jgi:hypothetical protein
MGFVIYYVIKGDYLIQTTCNTATKVEKTPTTFKTNFAFLLAPSLVTEPVFLNVYGAPELILKMNSASLAGRYDNPIPPRFLAPIDFLKIPALNNVCFYAY